MSNHDTDHTGFYAESPAERTEREATMAGALRAESDLPTVEEIDAALEEAEEEARFAEVVADFHNGRY